MTSSTPVCRRRSARVGSVLLWMLSGCGTAADLDTPMDAGRESADAAGIDAPAEITNDAGASAPEDAGPLDGSAPHRVLFIGNSYTFVNDLPAVVHALGVSTPGAGVEVESVTVGSARLGDHWMTTGARERVAAGGLDVVVIQGQSREPIIPDTEYAFQYYAGLFGDAVHDAGARGVWFATWARRAGDPVYFNLAGVEISTPARMTYDLEAAYAQASYRHTDDLVARVGAAWELAIAELPAVELYDGDGSHPSAAGTLLSACVIFDAITRGTARVPDPPPLGVPVETANALCAIAPRVRCLRSFTDCDGYCVNVYNDVANCGACGHACPGSLSCNAGECGCPIGLTACGDSCKDLHTDRENCGACGTSCADSGQPCYGGACACPSADVLWSGGFAAFTALRPGCVPWEAAATADCTEAIHEYCASRECFDSGFGSPGGSGRVICLGGGVRETTFTELSTWVAACDGASDRSGADCSAAIHRYCVSTGAASGFGPVESAGDEVTVTCVPRATLIRTDYATLGGFFAMCDGVATRWGQPCNAASWFQCASLGHAGGFGPVEAAGTDADIVCVDP